MTDRLRDLPIPVELGNAALGRDLHKCLVANGVRRPRGVMYPLLKAGLTFRDVWEMTDEELISVRNFGVNNLQHLDDALGQLVLTTLGTKTTE